MSPRIRQKLEDKHGVSEEEVRQCFQNVEGEFLRDRREDHRTDPPTHWFIAPTNRNRLLKVVFVARKEEAEDGTRVRIDVKTAYPPAQDEIDIYDRHGKY